MSEKINELIKSVKDLKYDSSTGTFETDRRALFEFAELIVRECTNVALEQKKQVEEMEVYNLQDEVWNRARIQQSEHIVDKIKEHFGVEE